MLSKMQVILIPFASWIQSDGQLVKMALDCCLHEGKQWLRTSMTINSPALKSPSVNQSKT